MRLKFFLGLVSTLMATSSFAGSVNSQFEIKVKLNNICTSTTGLLVGSASVNIRCSANVFVYISQIASAMRGLQNLPYGANFPIDFDTSKPSRAAQLAQIKTNDLLGPLGTQTELVIANSGQGQGQLMPPVEMMVTF
jgi:hypothetical protein